MFERLLRTAFLPSRPADLETAVDGGGNALQVIWVRADHELVTAHGSLHPHTRTMPVVAARAVRDQPSC